jgi:hypothetical protein
MGFTETRCRVCGMKVSRLRAGFIATISLTAGVTLGWFAITLLHL